MANFADVYDQTRTRMAALFPNAIELANTYALEENSSVMLRDGWGLTVGGSLPHSTGFHSFQLERSTIGVILTTEIVTTDHNADPMFEAIKTLKSQAVEVYKDLLSPAVDPIMVFEGMTAPIQIQETSGDSGRGMYFSIELSFTVITTESIKET